jgi:hypothetical protein
VSNVQFIALGTHAISIPDWRWAEGMLTVGLKEGGGLLEGWCRLLRVEDGVPTSWTTEDSDIVGEADGTFDAYCESIPVLTDDATVGCIEALVVKKHGPDTYCIPRFENGVVLGWTVQSLRLYDGRYLAGYGWPSGTTKVEALLAALEVA